MRFILLIGCASMSLTALACGRSQPQTNAAPVDTSSPAAAAAASGNVTLVGCLQGSELPRATGTAGSPNADRASGHTAPAGRFVLTNATVANAAAGANGAGGSGGPLVNAAKSFELDGVPPDAQVSVNKRVRITGRVDERAPASTPAESTSSTTGQRQTANDQRRPTAGSTEDSQANSLTVAGDATTRRVKVETVQVIAQDCNATR
jgi:hypothetical protein